MAIKLLAPAGCPFVCLKCYVMSISREVIGIFFLTFIFPFCFLPSPSPHFLASPRSLCFFFLCKAIESECKEKIEVVTVLKNSVCFHPVTMKESIFRALKQWHLIFKSISYRVCICFGDCLYPLARYTVLLVRQGFKTSQYWHSGPDNSLLIRDFLEHCRMFICIPDLYPVDASSTPFILGSSKNVSRHWYMSPVGQSCHRLRTTQLGEPEFICLIHLEIGQLFWGYSQCLKYKYLT